MLKNFHPNLCDLMLSRPGNPNRIISATLLIPCWGSGGTSTISFVIGTGTCDGVIGGDKATASLAETLPNMGKQGFIVMSFVSSVLLLFLNVDLK